jgi:plasmid stabilization system protein ParE
MRRVGFHPAARAEILEAAGFYASAAPDLQRRFLAAVDRALLGLSEYPESGAPFGGRLRRGLVARFPYGSSTGSSRTACSSWP